MSYGTKRSGGFKCALVLTVVLAVVLASAGDVRAATRYAHSSVTSYKWENNGWTVPGVNDEAWIGDGATLRFDATTGLRTVLTVAIGHNAGTRGGAGTLLMQGGTLLIQVSGTNTGGTLYIGRSADANSPRPGTLNQSGGYIKTNYLRFGHSAQSGTCRYYISGGTMWVVNNIQDPNSEVGADDADWKGEMHLRGGYLRVDGTVQISNLLVKDNGGTYSISQASSANAATNGYIAGDVTVLRDMTISSGTGQATYTLHSSGGNLTVTNNLIIADDTGGQGTLNINKNATHTVTGNVYVGGSGGTTTAGGAGTIIQTTGTLSMTATNKQLLLAQATGGTGFYKLTGGYFSCGSQIRIGYQGAGTLWLSGGSASVQGNITIGNVAGSTGRVIIDNAASTLDTASNMNLGYDGSAQFDHSAGTFRIAGISYIGQRTGANGTYNLSGSGVFIQNSTTNPIRIGHETAGRVNQTGGKVLSLAGINLAHAAGGVGTYVLSSGAIEALDRKNINVGYIGSGVFLMSGGNISGAEVVVGHDAGAYGKFVMTGGTIVQDPDWYFRVGHVGAGFFYQSGGYIDTKAGPSGGSTGMLVGNLAGASGEYYLSGTGSLKVRGDLEAGRNAAGKFIQSGGNAVIDGALKLGSGVGGAGSYYLNDGSLTATNAVVGSGTAAGLLDWTGGSLSITNLTVNGLGKVNSYTDLNLLGTLTVAGGSVNLGSNDLSFAGGSMSAGRIEAGTVTAAGGSFTQTGGSVVINSTDSIIIGTGAGAATYAFGDAFSTGSVVEGTPGVNMTVNTGGVFKGWTNDGALNGMTLTGTLTSNGQVVGDSYDTDGRSMDLTSFATIDNTVDNSAPTGDAGWYAVNEGRVVLPTVTAPESLTPVSVVWGEAAGDTAIDLVNSARLDFSAVGSGGLDLDISLLANDDPDDVLFDWNVGWTMAGTKAIGVWEILSPATGGDDLAGESWTVTFRYDYNLLADLLATDPNFAGMDEYDLRVYYYDTAMGRWVMLTKDALAEIDTTNKLITADSGVLAQYGSGGEGLYAVVIPEPGTLALLALGGLGILVRRRRRRA